MSQQKGMNLREFWQRFQTERACEAYLFGRCWSDSFISAPNAEEAVVIGFADAGNISANIAIDKVRLQWELFYTVPIFR